MKDYVHRLFIYLFIFKATFDSVMLTETFCGLRPVGTFLVFE